MRGLFFALALVALASEARADAWNAYLDAPPAYASFARSVERVATYAADDFDVEVYRQKNGPETYQRVFVSVPRSKAYGSGKYPVVIVPFYYPEGMLGFNPSDGSTTARAERGAKPLTYYHGVTMMADLTRRGYVCVSADAYYLTYATQTAPDELWAKWRHVGLALAKDWPTWTGMGKLAFDTRLLIDLIERDPRVDATRIGMAGHSLGGKMATFAGLCDRRVKAVLVSDSGVCWDHSNWDDAWYFGDKLKEMRAKGLDHANLYDRNPKPLCLLCGSYDGDWSRELLGTRARIINPKNGVHRPLRSVLEQGYRFLDAHLKPPAVRLAEMREIVVPSGEGALARHLKTAADTIADVYREAFGQRPRVVTAAGRSHGPAICLGSAAAEKAGFSVAGFQPMENVIAEKDGNVYLFGRDRQCSPQATSWFACELGSACAAARFLETYLDARFLMPGDAGLDVPPNPVATIDAGLIDRKIPTQQLGNGRFHGMMYDLANGIYGNGCYHFYGGHTYPLACPPEKYFKDHPEYFALRAGKRVGAQGNPALCISNPAVEDLVVKEILSKFDAGFEVVELGQNDGLDYCQCEKCAALGQGLGYGEQFLVFHRRVAERLYKLRPEKKVLIIAYSVTSLPPRTFRGFPPNVMIELCHPTVERLAAWKAFGVPNGFTTYVYHWGTYPMPGHTAKRTFKYCADEAKLCLTNGVKGVYRCGYGELFGVEGPAYYVFNRTLMGSTLTIDQLVDEYLRRAYGPAAQPMNTFFRTLDEQLRVFCAGLHPSNPVALLASIYTPDVLARLEGALTAAESLAATEKQKRRLALTRVEFENAKSLGTIAHLYFAYRLNPTEALFEPLAAQIEKRNAFLDSLFDEKGRKKYMPGFDRTGPLGHSNREYLTINGYMTATLGSPYRWDVGFMRANRILPGSSRKSLDVRRANEKPTLAAFKSGAGAWATATWAELNGIALEKVSSKARFKALADDANLYVGIEASLADDVVARKLGHDGKPWTQDCLELMVDPTGAGLKMFHFFCNATKDSWAESACGLIQDPIDPKFGKEDMSWDGAWSYETDRANGIWRVVMTIPFATMGAKRPVTGETWRMNVGREAYPGEKLRRVEGAEIELMLWNPDFELRSMANPTAFGKIVFR